MSRRYDHDVDDRPRRSRGQRKNGAFPVWIIVLVLGLPLLAAGGYFGYKALKKSESSGSTTTTDPAEKMKQARARLIGSWAVSEGGITYELNFGDDGLLTISAG